MRVKGLTTLCVIAVSFLWHGTARADSYERPPRPYELQGVKLSWIQVPYPHFAYEYPTGWQLSNPKGFGCQPCYDSRHWFSCRIRVEPISKTLTIVTASETESPLE